MVSTFSEMCYNAELTGARSASEFNDWLCVVLDTAQFFKIGERQTQAIW